VSFAVSPWHVLMRLSDTTDRMVPEELVWWAHPASVRAAPTIPFPREPLTGIDQVVVGHAEGALQVDAQTCRNSEVPPNRGISWLEAELRGVLTNAFRRAPLIGGVTNFSQGRWGSFLIAHATAAGRYPCVESRRMSQLYFKQDKSGQGHSVFGSSHDACNVPAAYCCVRSWGARS
jgi:hypothetical protein